VTKAVIDTPVADAGPEPEQPAPADTTPPTTTSDGGGCTTAPTQDHHGLYALALAAAIVGSRLRRRN
jgi:MYXO-CTERM domain-containing protein